MTIPGHHNYFMLLLFLCGLLGRAQNYTILGVVADVDKQPISFVNVVTNKASTDAEGNSGYTFINGTTTGEQGAFKIENLEAGAYLISFIYLGYHINSVNVTVSENMDLGVIQLEKSVEDLDEAVVYSKRPTIRKEPGKLIFTVEGTSLANGNVAQLLSKNAGGLDSTGTH